MPVASASWAALAIGLAALGAVLSWIAYRRRGPVAGLRGVAWTLLPIAAWLTGTLSLAGEIGSDVSAWAAHLIFSPFVWAGIAVAGVSAMLFVATSLARSRAGGAGTSRKPRDAQADRAAKGSTPQVGPGKGSRRPADDGVDDEIAAILRKHGIS